MASILRKVWVSYDPCSCRQTDSHCGLLLAIWRPYRAKFSAPIQTLTCSSLSLLEICNPESNTGLHGFPETEVKEMKCLGLGGGGVDSLRLGVICWSKLILPDSWFSCFRYSGSTLKAPMISDRFFTLLNQIQVFKNQTWKLQTVRKDTPMHTTPHINDQTGLTLLQ